MGSYAECWAGNFYLGKTEDEVNPFLMRIFRATDRKVITSNKENLPSRLSRLLEYIEDEEDVTTVFYSVSATVAKDRLELIGYSLENSKKAFAVYLGYDISEREIMIRDYGYAFESGLRILREMNLDKWISTLKEIHDKGFVHEGHSRKDDGTLLSYMLHEDWYGFPGVDLSAALRLALEVIPESEDLIYDVTEFIFKEDFEVDEDLAEWATIITSPDHYNNGKCIILTEGKSDTSVLSQSLNLLYPHLADYFTFIDFDGAKLGGGAGSLANMVKSFSGAGIINKVVAVFDNDTAAHSALTGLRDATISKNIKVFTLPDIDILNNYPTIGPSGMAYMNVNRLAGSIETYLGHQCLSDPQGNYYPIQWTGLDARLQKYQGEITRKDRVQKNFKEQLRICNEDRSSIEKYDWSGVKAILEGIFTLFHENDGKQIISLAEECCKHSKCYDDY